MVNKVVITRIITLQQVFCLPQANVIVLFCRLLLCVEECLSTGGPQFMPKWFAS